jgi:hypothetical protein
MNDTMNMPLLFKGDDFTATDVRACLRIAPCPLREGTARGSGKGRVRQEKGVRAKRNLYKTEKRDPERTEQCKLENVHCQCPLLPPGKAAISINRRVKEARMRSSLARRLPVSESISKKFILGPNHS